MTGLLAHSIWLTLVLCNTGVYGLDNIWANWWGEDLFSIIDQQCPPEIPLKNHLPQPNRNPSTPHFEELAPYLWERVAGAADSSVSGQDRDSWAGSHLEVEFVVELLSGWRWKWSSFWAKLSIFSKIRDAVCAAKMGPQCRDATRDQIFYVPTSSWLIDSVYGTLASTFVDRDSVLISLLKIHKISGIPKT